MKRVYVLTSLVMIAVLLSIPQAFQSISAVPGDPATSILYGTDREAGGAFLVHVVTINPITGVQTPLPSPIQDPVVAGLPGLAVDKTTGKLYATENSLDTIFEIDTATGIETPVGGPFNFGNMQLGEGNVASLDFGPDGKLYGAANLAGGGGTGPDHLVTIDTTTGLATVIGPFGVCQNLPNPFPPAVGGVGSCDIEGIAAIGFDTSGQLFGILRGVNVVGANSVPNGVYQINTATGAANHVATISNPPGGGIASMEFACDDSIYVGTHKLSGGELGTVTVVGNVGTYSSIGGGTNVGNDPLFGPFGPNALAGLAFDTACEGPSAIGGELLPIDSGALLVAGAQANASWMIALAASIVGIGAAVIRKTLHK